VVIGLVAVPGRAINAELEPAFLAGIGQFADHVAFAILPGAVPDAMPGRGGRPKAKSIVMLGGENNSLEAAFPCGPHPLVTVKVRGVEKFWIFVAQPGAAAGKRVHS